MRAEVQHHLLLTSAEDHRVCQSGHTGSDFDRSSTSVVEDSPFESPAVDVPDPASNWAVNEGCPDEEEDHHWDEAAAFSDGTNDDSTSDGAELHLCEN
jgi:hypothetical protein